MLWPEDNSDNSRVDEAKLCIFLAAIASSCRFNAEATGGECSTCTDDSVWREVRL